MGELSGKVKEAVGYVTGDRRQEAKGRVEQRTTDPADAASAETAGEVEAEERDVRREHGEYQPERLDQTG